LISRALHLDVFDQPGEKLLFQQPLIDYAEIFIKNPEVKTLE
jgi:hypothetical protein